MEDARHGEGQPAEQSGEGEGEGAGGGEDAAVRGEHGSPGRGLGGVPPAWRGSGRPVQHLFRRIHNGLLLISPPCPVTCIPACCAASSPPPRRCTSAGAAEQLHIAEQALSRDIKALELALGGALFTPPRAVSNSPRPVPAAADGPPAAAPAGRDPHGRERIRPPAAAAGPQQRRDRDDLTADRLLAHVRAAWPEGELLARFHADWPPPRPR
ncbi:LysR family transcriptional regulator [Streptomyces lusitanus]|uniref:helix-turn-helix domain-containing protein n=1 Tax=Streptomyces lusitanus TaxID=68232 RepID=UPI00363ECC7F